MSELPKGTSAARSFLDSVAVEGAMASLTAWAPPLGWPVISDVVRVIIEHEIVDPTLDEAVALAIAVKYVADRKSFDAQYVKLKMLEQESATPYEQEAALEEAENAMARFIRRGPVQ